MKYNCRGGVEFRTRVIRTTTWVVMVEECTTVCHWVVETKVILGSGVIRSELEGEWVEGTRGHWGKTGVRSGRQKSLARGRESLGGERTHWTGDGPRTGVGKTVGPIDRGLKWPRRGEG